MDEVERVSAQHVQEFNLRLQGLFLVVHAAGITDDIMIEIRERMDADFYGVLMRAVTSRTLHKDLVLKYFEAANEVSQQMNGFPEETLLRYRSFQSEFPAPAPPPRHPQGSESTFQSNLSTFAFLICSPRFATKSMV